MPLSIVGLCDNETTTGDDRPGRHVLSALSRALGLVTKCRCGVLTGEHLDTLRAVFASVGADVDAELVELDGQDDHVHLLTAYSSPPHPRSRLPGLVNSLKGVSARRLRQHYRVRTHREHLWSPSHVAASAAAAAGQAQACAPLETSRSTSASNAPLTDRAHPP